LQAARSRSSTTGPRPCYRAIRFAGIPALVRGGRRCRGSFDPATVFVADFRRGAETMSEAKSEQR
jgi:hypothetical protein